MNDAFNSSPFDAFSSSEGEPAPVPSLDDGLAALKRKDYKSAIAQLEAVCQATSDRPTQIKAQIGLVKAYRATGQVKWAIALCQPLCKSSSQQVQQWAEQTLRELTQTQSPEADRIAADQTGFMPLPQGDRSTQPSSNKEQDDTGFTLIQNTASAKRRPQPNLPSISAVNRRPEVVSDRPAEEPDARFDSALGASSPENPFVFEDSFVAEEPARATSPMPQGLPTTRQKTPSSDTSPLPQRALVWKQAGRAQKWGSLGKIDRWKLWTTEAGTAIALFFVLRGVLQFLFTLFNNTVARLSFPVDLRYLAIYSDPGLFVFWALLLLFALSPWLLDAILQRGYAARPFKLETLSQFSPEANRVLRRVCTQRGSPLPGLSIIPIAAPLIFTYGYLPQNSRIVVSQGLLEQLNDDEMASLYAGEIAHVHHWDGAILSWVTLVAHVPFFVYWQVASWGNRQNDRVLQTIAVGISAFAYGLYRVLRLPGVWLSRSRLYYSDRAACEMTGNPNALTRALLKVTIGTAQEIQRQGYTSPVVESFDLLTPVGYRTALTVGSVSLYAPLEDLLQWDRQNRHRHWLAVNNAHPLMGDRLHLLALYARHWRLPTELDWKNSESTISSRSKPFWLQIAPYLGLPIGLAIAGTLWLFGAIADRLNWLTLDWMWGDASLLTGCIAICLSMGIFVRINRFFPDIKHGNLRVEPLLPDLLTSPNTIPLDSQPVRLQGKLLGRKGIPNLLGQDLVLQTQAGLIKLHHASPMGAIGNLFPANHPHLYVNTPVTVTGWFRRGATPWIDIDTLRPQRGALIQNNHPLWSTVLAIGLALWGAWVIAQG